MQSGRTLDDFLPGFAPSWGPDKREVGSSNLPRPIGTEANRWCRWPSDALSGIAALHLDRSPSSAAAPNVLHFGGERLCGFTGTGFGPRFG